MQKEQSKMKITNSISREINKKTEENIKKTMVDMIKKKVMESRMK